jgi:hypothetical protein
MSDLANHTFEIACPNPRCEHGIELKYRDVAFALPVHCHRCGAHIKFHSSMTFKFSQALKELEHALVHLEQVKEQLLNGADVKLPGM